MSGSSPRAVAVSKAGMLAKRAAPARPARAPDTSQTTSTMRRDGIPLARARSGFADTARIALPSRVRAEQMGGEQRGSREAHDDELVARQDLAQEAIHRDRRHVVAEEARSDDGEQAIPEHEAQCKRGDEHAEGPRATPQQRLEDGSVHGHAERPADGRRDREGQPGRNARLIGEEGAEPADRHDIDVGQVEDARHGILQREADGGEREDRRGDQPEAERGDEDVHDLGSPRSVVAKCAGPPATKPSREAAVAGPPVARWNRQHAYSASAAIWSGVNVTTWVVEVGDS